MDSLARVAPAGPGPFPAGRLGPRASLAWAGACFAVGALFFYRDILLSGFDLVFGDDGDARLAMLLMEHWRRVLSGEAAFLSPIFFYPARGVIGFTDANFLYGLVFSLGRWAGLTIYGAFQLVVIAWGAIGYAAMFWLLRRVLWCNLPVCLLWSSLFAFSNLNALQVGHMQLLVVAFVPVLVGCVVLLWRGLVRSSRVDRAAGGVVAILYPLMAFTGFYVSWFAALFAATVLVAGCFWMIASGRWSQVTAALAAAWHDRLRLLALCVTAAIFSVPFVMAYGPQLLHNNGFSDDALFRSTFPHLRDLIDVGTDNLVWGGFMTWLIPDLFSRLGGYELAMGMPPGFLLLFAVATVLAVHAARQGGDPLPAVLAVCVWAGLLMIVDLHGHSAWWAVRGVVPGARSLRVVSRYQVVLYAMALVASAKVVSGSTDGLLTRPRAGRAALAAACAAFLLLEQVQPTFARVSKSADLARLGRVPPPPASCRFFVLAPAQGTGDHDAFVRREQVDAIYEAMRFGLPTVNGLSSLNPPGYWFYDLASPDYALEAGMWLARFNLLEGACTLDLARASWAGLQADPAPLPLSVNLLDLPQAERTFAGGMRFADLGFAGPMPTPWTGRESRWTFTTPRRQGSVKLRFAVVNKDGTDVVLSVNGVAVQHEHLPPGPIELVQPVNAPVAEVGMQSTTFRPSADGTSHDTRDLGVLVTWLSLEP